jgi:gluconate kinase
VGILSTMKANSRGFAVKVIWLDGDEEYLHEGMSERTARFFTEREAKEQAEFMKMGMSDECQSINVVPYPGSLST